MDLLQQAFSIGDAYNLIEKKSSHKYMILINLKICKIHSTDSMKTNYRYFPLTFNFL